MKKKGVLSICMLMLSFASGMAEGANWQRIAEYEDTIIYIDKESIRNISEPVVRAQFKIVYQEPFWVKSKSVTYYLIEQENNCSEKKYKVYQVTVHFDDGTSDNFRTQEEHDVRSDTFQSAIYDFVCKKTK